MFTALNHKTLMSCASVAALATGLSMSAQAQDGESSNDYALEEITITAQKRAESLQDVPLSVTAVTGDSLLNNGITDLSRLEILAPGLQFGASGTDARPAIRGARTENVSVQQDPVIGFFVDGVYRSRTSQALAAFVDVQRVEVLRGPQGTLFGRNTFGGAVSVISNAPSAEQEFGADVTIGNFNRRRVEGFANAPLTDNLFLRVSASIDDHDFIIKNSFNPGAGQRDKNEDYVRLQLRWEPADNVDVTVRASRWNQGGAGSSDFGNIMIGTPTDLDGDGSFSIDEALNGVVNPINPRVGSGIGVAADSDPYNIARDFAQTLNTEQETLDLELNWDLGFATAKVLLAYADFEQSRDSDSDLSINSSAVSGQIDAAETYTQELQLTSNSDGPLQWTVGAFLLQDDTVGTFFFDRLFATDGATNTPLLDTPAPTSDFNTLAQVNTDSIAFYGQATYALTDALRFTGGIRWTEDQKDFTRFVNFAFAEPLDFGDTPSTVDSATFSRVTWKLGIDYDLSDDTLLYATASTGFQSGGFNNSVNSTLGTASFDEQLITAYEIGTKNTLDDGRITLNVAAYLNEFTDLLAQEFIDVGTTVVSVSTNAGAATVWGVEAEMDWKPVPEALINLRGTYNDAQFDRFLIGEPISGQTIDLDGGRVPFTPDFTFSVSGLYDFQLSSGMITPAFTLYYSDSFSTNDVDYNFGEQEAFAKLDLRLTYTSESEAWYVEAFGRNITDVATITRTVRFGQNALTQTFADPATYGVRFGFRF